MASKPEREYTLGQFQYDMEKSGVGEGCTPFLVGSLLLAFVPFLIFFLPVRELADQREAQIAVIDMFDVDGSRASQVKQRQELAESILVVRKYDGSIPGFQDAQLEKQLSSIAKTGQPLELKPVDPNRLGRLWSFLLWWVFGMLCLASLGHGLRYLDLCSRKGYRLWALLPWHRRWAWLVPLRAPWLIPFLIGSLIWALYDSHKANKAAPKK